MSDSGDARSVGFAAPGRAILFGYDPTPAEARLLRRSLGWRAGGAARTMLLFLVVAPVVAIVPPHAPWVIGALLTGIILARRRWQEEITLQALDGTCPKCGTTLAVRPGRLRAPHPLPCEACHHESSLRIAPADLAGPGAAGE